LDLRVSTYFTNLELGGRLEKEEHIETLCQFTCMTCGCQKQGIGLILSYFLFVAIMF
jgi:hypothetical protein